MCAGVAGRGQATLHIIPTAAAWPGGEMAALYELNLHCMSRGQQAVVVVLARDGIGFVM